ncbi:hypothetical protein [Streptomyces sp. P9-A2]|uniref:hypothetical protein n=1 Tax=Streptomyces sp. P9-A2 TaxID=3072284 RepID=UPI003FCE00AD
MPEVFVNYRTGDEESAATMIARELSRRFGLDELPGSFAICPVCFRQDDAHPERW